VGADLEAIPRQPLQPVAYAIGLLAGAVISAASAAPALEVANLTTGVRVTSTTGAGLRGETASILPGRAGVLGLAGEPPIDPPDEAGVLGKSTEGIGVAGLSLNDVGMYGYSVNNDGVWGNASAPSASRVYGSHFGNGWGGYFYSANGTGLAANSATNYAAFFGSGVGQAIYASGSVTVTGDVNAYGLVRTQRVQYLSPHVHEFTVGGEGFVPGSNVDYINTYGNGGAYIAAATSGGLVAPVHLPQGARVTRLTVYAYDGSGSDMSVWLARLSMATGGYAIVADINTAGAPGYASWTNTAIALPIIDNTTFAYHIYAYSSAWDGGNLRIMGARVTYELDEAP